MVGVCMFATPCSENVRRWFYGEQYKNGVTELHRLCVLSKEDWERPDNVLSWFVSKSLKQLHIDYSHLHTVVSFSDSSQGHHGGIYRATNALYFSTTKSSSVFYRDSENRLRHPRQNGRNISKQEALSKGWVPEKRGVKHKYAWLICNKRLKKVLIKILKEKHKTVNWKNI